MTELERNLPIGPNMCLDFLLNQKKKDINEKTYDVACEKFELGIEKCLINTLSRVGIAAMTKTDRFSLPYNNEVVVTLKSSSFMDDAFEVHMVARKIIKQLLNDNVFQLRFYMFVEVSEKGVMGYGSIDYHFRYYTRN